MPREQLEHRPAEGAVWVLGPELVRLGAAGDGGRLVLDDLDRPEAVLQRGDLGRDGRQGQTGRLSGARVPRARVPGARVPRGGEGGQVAGRAEPGVGGRRGVGGDGGADHDGGHGDDDEEQDEQLLAPLAPEEAPGPADHRPAGRDAAGGRFGARLGARPLEDADAHWFGRSREDGFRALERERLVDDPAVAQEDHAVGPRGELGVVGHDHGGQAAMAGGEDQAHDGLGVGGVERARGLVGQEELAVAHHGAGDGDPLALATRQLVGVARRPVLQPEVVERLERRRLGLAGRDAVELEGQGHVLHRTEPGQQVVVLEHVADGLATQAGPAVA